ncbi:hypothetical protein SAMN05421780_101507 [Flexibacter flexilis DSM 6793]|uniref:Uncharacterized protein n=1 Tax=Flexibacter flexilis DSM 6793 TaxID=927664 RepID=A0A1I1E2X7_9BACT|nr:hypothetical protein SAMN05421780_101507 [Flexibacter flexilis DSM 6793]
MQLLKIGQTTFCCSTLQRCNLFFKNQNLFYFFLILFKESLYLRKYFYNISLIQILHSINLGAY